MFIEIIFIGLNWFTVLVSGVQQSDWVIHVHISMFFKFFSRLGYYRIFEQSPLCYIVVPSVQFSRSVVSTLCDLMDCSMPGFPVFHRLPELAQTLVHWVSDAIQPSHPLSSLLLPPSVFPSTRVFSSESALRIRWPKCWSFSFSISPCNEYSGLISFRMDWLDLLAVQGTLKIAKINTL